MNKPRIMECTLRDGSYQINFQFTSGDTEIIAGTLDRLGFDFIEVGHGIGLGASEAGMGRAAETDRAYMEAAARAVTRGSWGMFCIPGIARLEHLDLAAEHGMDFVRIGTEVSDAAAGWAFVERAKAHGMMVCANFMKSYAIAPAEFAKVAADAAKAGVDYVYIVDSAGGMLGRELRTYADAVRSVTDVGLGFHGHNNMGLAVSNALEALECGISVIDTSLQGFGRSAGNTPTEQFLCLLERSGIDTGIDLIQVMDMGEKYIKPLISAQGLNSLDITAGFALFHSSYFGVIREFSAKHHVDPRRLIIELCRVDKVNAPRELVESLAVELAAKTPFDEPVTSRFQMARYHGAEQR